MTAGLCFAGLATAGEPLEKLKSIGTAGKAVYPFTDGDKTEAVLFEHTGAGCLTHMWFGGRWPNYENLRIRVYVDGEAPASIDMRLFLGHGIGYEDTAAPWGTKRIGKTGQPSGIYNNYRIPFGTSVRVTAQLAAGDAKNRSPISRSTRSCRPGELRRPPTRPTSGPTSGPRPATNPETEPGMPGSTCRGGIGDCVKPPRLRLA